MKNIRMKSIVIAVGILAALISVSILSSLMKNDGNVGSNPSVSEQSSSVIEKTTEPVDEPEPASAKTLAESFQPAPEWEIINDIEHIFAVSDCGPMPCSTIQRDWDMKTEISTAELQKRIDEAGWDIQVTGDCQSVSTEPSRCAARSVEGSEVSIAVFVREGESTTLSLYIETRDNS